MASRDHDHTAGFALDSRAAAMSELALLIERLRERRQIQWNAPMKDGGWAKLVHPEDLEAAIQWLLASDYRLDVESAALRDCNELRKEMLESLKVAAAALEEIAVYPGPNADDAAHWRANAACDALHAIGPAIAKAAPSSAKPAEGDSSRDTDQ